MNLITQKDTAQAANMQSKANQDERVYVSLEQLVRLQHKARGYSFLPKQPVQSLLSGKHASRLRGRGLNFEELRQYRPGDDIRTMDWKVTARTRRPHVKVFSEERDRSVLLLVDQRQHMFFGSQVMMKSVVAAEAAALGAWKALSVGDRVGAIVFNDTRTVEIKPQRSKTTVMQILKSIVEMNLELSADSTVLENPGQLDAVLEKAVRLARHDHLVILISDFLGVTPDTTRLTAKLAAHNDMLGLLMVDPTRQSPKIATGRGVLTNGRQQIEFRLDDQRITKRIAEDYRRELSSIKESMQKMSAPLLPISTAEDVVLQIRRLIGASTRGAIRK